MTSLVNSNYSQLLGNASQANEFTDGPRDPFLEDWIDEHLQALLNNTQSPMNALDQYKNHQTAGSFDDLHSNALIKDGLSGCNRMSLVEDCPILPRNNIPLPYIPAGLLESLSKTIFATKDSIYPHKNRITIAKKINSHAKKDHQVRNK